MPRMSQVTQDDAGQKGTESAQCDTRSFTVNAKTLPVVTLQVREWTVITLINFFGWDIY